MAQASHPELISRRWYKTKLVGAKTRRQVTAMPVQATPPVARTEAAERALAKEGGDRDSIRWPQQGRCQRKWARLPSDDQEREGPDDNGAADHDGLQWVHGGTVPMPPERIRTRRVRRNFPQA